MFRATQTTFLEDSNYYIVNPWNLKIRTLTCDKLLFTIHMHFGE